MRFFTFMLVFALACTAYAQGSYPVPVLNTNQFYDLKTGEEKSTESNTPKYMYENYVKYKAPYTALYKFKVQPGKSYTFFECQKGLISTVYPKLFGKSLVTDTMHTLKGPQGFWVGAWHREFMVNKWTKEDAGAQCDARRMNITIAKESQHDNLYLYLASDKPESEVTVRLSEPADNPVEVKNSTRSPYRPRMNKNWGIVAKNPLMLINVPGDMDRDVPASIADRLMNGETITVVFDALPADVDSGGWSGRENDPLGAVAAGETYALHFAKSAGGWRAKGFYEESGSVRTFMELGGDPRNNELNIFGRIFFYSENGQVFDKELGLAGHIK